MKTKLGFLALLFVLSSQAAKDPPATVEKVDLDRYLGLWHEIARLPMFAQRGCTHSTANYSLRDDGDIRVENRCVRIKNGESKEIAKIARGWVDDSFSTAKLKIRFVWWLPRIADARYWILKLDEDYKIALVGTPDYKYLWVLAREKTLSESVLSEWISFGRSLGYDTSKMIVNPAHD